MGISQHHTGEQRRRKRGERGKRKGGTHTSNRRAAFPFVGRTSQEALSKKPHIHNQHDNKNNNNPKSPRDGDEEKAISISKGNPKTYERRERWESRRKKKRTEEIESERDRKRRWNRWHCTRCGGGGQEMDGCENEKEEERKKQANNAKKQKPSDGFLFVFRVPSFPFFNLHRPPTQHTSPLPLRRWCGGQSKNLHKHLTSLKVQTVHFDEQVHPLLFSHVFHNEGEGRRRCQLEEAQVQRRLAGVCRLCERACVFCFSITLWLGWFGMGFASSPNLIAHRGAST